MSAFNGIKTLFAKSSLQKPKMFTSSVFLAIFFKQLDCFLRASLPDAAPYKVDNI